MKLSVKKPFCEWLTERQMPTVTADSIVRWATRALASGRRWWPCPRPPRLRKAGEPRLEPAVSTRPLTSRPCASKPASLRARAT